MKKGMGLFFVVLSAGIFVFSPVNGWAAGEKKSLLFIIPGIGTGTHQYFSTASVIIHKYTDIKVTLTPVKGTYECLTFLTKGKGDLAPGSGFQISEFINGAGKAKEFGPNPKIRAFWAYVNNPSHFLTLKGSGIKSLKDLKGKKLAIGPHAGTHWIAEVALEAVGIDKEKDLSTRRYSAFPDMMDALKDGVVDAALFTLGAPSGAVSELFHTRKDAVALPFPDEVIQYCINKYPNEIVRTKFPVGIYPGIDKDVPVTGTFVLFAGTTDIPDEIAYKFTKTFFSHRDEAIKGGISESQLVLASMEFPFPRHPGCERALKELGILR